MAYAKKYLSEFNSQSGEQIYIELWEDGYDGSVIEYPCDSFNLQYIPQGDDPFEMIYASQVNVELDVTDNVENMPDFTTLNDRKYLCKVIKDSTLEWQGWVLSDDVQFNFSTGIKSVFFNAVCGLGMLKDITFSESELTETNVYKSILYCLCKAISDVETPTDNNIFASVSIYAEAMNDRNDEPYFDPFQQSFIQLSGIIENNEYISSLDLIKNILKSFGCRIFYAKGRWNILQINQMALPNPYYTLYDIEGTILSSGTLDDISNVPTDMIFVTGNQIKILKKGFNNIISRNKIEYPENYIFNANLKLFSNTGITPGWVRSNLGTGVAFVIEKVGQEFNYWELETSGGINPPMIEVVNTAKFLIPKYDIINFKYSIINSFPQSSPSGNVSCKMIMVIEDGVDTYYVSNDLVGNKKGAWRLLSGVLPDYYTLEDDPDSVNKNFTSLPAPITGNAYIGFRLDTDTGEYLLIGDFTLTVDSDFTEVFIESKIDETKAYTKSVEFPFGVNSNVLGKFSYKGFISDSNGNMLVNWYNLERPTDTYRSLAELMVKNYVIQYRKNIINIDSSIEGLTSGFNRLSFTDTDPEQVSVTDKVYLIGNTTISLDMNEFQGTLLEVTDTNQNATITTTYVNRTKGTEPTTNCVDGASFEVVVAGDISYALCEGESIIDFSGGIGPNVIADCIQFGSLLPYFGNGTPATIEQISYGGPCG